MKNNRIRINRNVGARVIVREVLLEISPKVHWRYAKKVYGTIVERGEYEQYYHTCSGGHNYVTKHVIKNGFHKTYSIKLDNDLVDIEGNNIVVFRDYDLKFLDRYIIPENPITEKQYLNAKKIVEKYEKNR